MSRKDLDTNQPFVEFFREFRDSSMTEKLLFISLMALVINIGLKLGSLYG